MTSPLRDAFHAALATLGDPLPRGAAAILAVSSEPGASVVQSAGDWLWCRDLAAAIGRSVRGDLPSPVVSSAEWILADLTGEGPRWHLAVHNAAPDPAGTVFFPMLGFIDDAANYEDCSRAPVTPPPPCPGADAALLTTRGPA